MSKLLLFPPQSAIHHNGFWRDLEAVFNQMGCDVYCGPSYVTRGFCAPGKHPHGRNSRHFRARALDIGYDPVGGPGESNYEKSFVDVFVKMMRARYPLMFVVWNRGPGDHRDHAHFDDQLGYPMDGRYTNIPLPNGILGFGNRGDKILDLQRRLNAGLVLDGIFGLATFDELRKFQHSKGLVPDGLAGPATFAALSEEGEEMSAEVVREIMNRLDRLEKHVGLTGGSAPSKPKPPPSAPSWRRVKGAPNGLNVRSGPGANNRIVDVLSNGDRWRVNDPVVIQNGWVRGRSDSMRAKGAPMGWVNARYIENW